MASTTTDLAEFYKSAGREQMRAAIRAWAKTVAVELEKELAELKTPEEKAGAMGAELRGGIAILDVLVQVLDQQSDTAPKA